MARRPNRPTPSSPKYWQTPEFEAENAYWRDQLRDSGFVDLEHGIDLNEIPAYTFRGDKFKKVTDTAAPPPAEDATFGKMTDTTPEGWAVLVKKAAELPVSYRYRDLLVDIAREQSIPAAVAARHGMNIPEARRVFVSFLNALGVNYAQYTYVRPLVVETIKETDTVEAWSVVSSAANALPCNYHHRAFIADVTRAGCIASSIVTAHGLTEKRARTVWRKFLAYSDLDHLPQVLVKGAAPREDE